MIQRPDTPALKKQGENCLLEQNNYVKKYEKKEKYAGIEK